MIKNGIITIKKDQANHIHHTIINANHIDSIDNAHQIIIAQNINLKIVFIY